MDLQPPELRSKLVEATPSGGYLVRVAQADYEAILLCLFQMAGPGGSQLPCRVSARCRGPGGEEPKSPDRRNAGGLGEIRAPADGDPEPPAFFPDSHRLCLVTVVVVLSHWVWATLFLSNRKALSPPHCPCLRPAPGMALWDSTIPTDPMPQDLLSGREDEDHPVGPDTWLWPNVAF